GGELDPEEDVVGAGGEALPVAAGDGDHAADAQPLVGVTARDLAAVEVDVALVHRRRAAELRARRRQRQQRQIGQVAAASAAVLGGQVVAAAVAVVAAEVADDDQAEIEPVERQREQVRAATGGAQ